MASAGNPKPHGAASPRTKLEPSLRYRKRSICVSALYLPLLVIPWILTCVMMFRPVRKPSYADHIGTDAYTDEDAQEMGRWLTAAKVMSTIATVIALPVISALLAHAAVRYSQRRREGQTLNLAQLFSLASRGWADIPLLWRTLDPDDRTGSPLLLFGALLVLITVIQPPIQSLMIRYESTSIATCQDVPSDSYGARHVREYCLPANALVKRQTQRWYDAEPGDLERCPQGVVIPKLINKMNALQRYDFQTHLWPEEISGYGFPPNATYINDYTAFVYWTWFRSPSPWSFFASSLPSGTTTGVLRYHALRQHSAASCVNVSQSSFPSTCAGSSPFTTTFSHEQIVVKVCVPGTSNQAPWTRSRNRQTIDEELWIDVRVNGSGVLRPRSFTTHCTSSSTRGYFELGNQYNGNVPGPLLEEWPSQEEIVADFNDATGIFVTSGSIPSEMAPAVSQDGLGPVWRAPGLDSDTRLSGLLPTPGPLMTSALALFGNTSFFFTTANATKTKSKELLKSICQGGGVPLALLLDNMSQFTSACYRVNDIDDADRLEERFLTLISGFVSQFSNTNMTKTMLDVAMFAANEILLTTTANTGSLAFSRPIYSSSGYEIHKPVNNISGIAVVSALLFLQVVAIVGLVIYNSSLPTWTSSLDGLAMAKIGKEINGVELPPLGVYDWRERAKLAEAEGIVGLVDKTGVGTDLGSETIPVLGLGASGVITRAAVSKKKATEDKV